MAELTPESRDDVGLPRQGGMCAIVERSLWLMSGVILLIAAISTWAFGAGYSATMHDAYSSIVFAEGAFARDTMGLALSARAVKWAAEQALIVCSLLLIATMWWRGSWMREIGGACARWRWWMAVAVFVITAAWSFFGQLLPMDQHAWHGTIVRAGIIESTPFLGEWLRGQILAGSEISGATLSFFNTMHIGVFPCLMVMLAIAMIRWDSRGSPTAKASLDTSLLAAPVIATMAVWILAATIGKHAIELGLAARPHAPFPDVRPEWFFIPLSKALAIVGSGPLAILVVLSPGAIIGMLVVWPWLAIKLKRSAQVAILCGLATGFVGLLAWQVGDDASAKRGWFAVHGLEALMLEMGRINESLGHPGEHDAKHAFAMAAELQVMARLTHDLSSHKDVKNADDWRKWSIEMDRAAARIWSSSSAPQAIESAINDMRAACQSCHIAHDKRRIDLFDKPRTATTPPNSQTQSDPKPSANPAPPAPSALTESNPTQPPFLNYFDPIIFEGARPPANPPTDLAMTMEKMGEAFDILNGTDKSKLPNAIAAMEQYWDLLKNMRDEDVVVVVSPQDWLKISDDGREATRALKTSQNEADYLKRLGAMRDQCSNCHAMEDISPRKIKPVRD